MAYNFPLGYQPAQIAYPQNQQSNGIIWVQGEAGAKSYLVAPNNSVVLWDTESPTIYVKSADGSGMPSMKILDYTTRSQDNQVPAADYITRTDFDEIKNDIENIKTELKDLSEKGKKQ